MWQSSRKVEAADTCTRRLIGRNTLQWDQEMFIIGEMLAGGFVHGPDVRYDVVSHCEWSQSSAELPAPEAQGCRTKADPAQEQTSDLQYALFGLQSGKNVALLTSISFPKTMYLDGSSIHAQQHFLPLAIHGSASPTKQEVCLQALVNFTCQPAASAPRRRPSRSWRSLRSRGISLQHPRPACCFKQLPIGSPIFSLNLPLQRGQVILGLLFQHLMQAFLCDLYRCAEETAWYHWKENYHGDFRSHVVAGCLRAIGWSECGAQVTIFADWRPCLELLS